MVEVIKEIAALTWYCIFCCHLMQQQFRNRQQSEWGFQVGIITTHLSPSYQRLLEKAITFLYVNYCVKLITITMCFDSKSLMRGNFFVSFDNMKKRKTTNFNLYFRIILVHKPLINHSIWSPQNTKSGPITITSELQLLIRCQKKCSGTRP